MKKIAIGLVAILVVAMGAIFVFAQTGGTNTDGMGKKGMHRGGKMHKRGGGMMLRGLELTDEQKTQVKSIHEANKTAVAPLRDAMKANRQKLQEATANGGFDEATISAVAAEHGNLAAQMLVARNKVQSQVFAILTDAQKTKMAEMKQKRVERSGKRGGRGKRSADADGMGM